MRHLPRVYTSVERERETRPDAMPCPRPVACSGGGTTRAVRGSLDLPGGFCVAVEMSAEWIAAPFLRRSVPACSLLSPRPALSRIQQAAGTWQAARSNEADSRLLRAISAPRSRWVGRCAISSSWHRCLQSTEYTSSFHGYSAGCTLIFRVCCRCVERVTREPMHPSPALALPACPPALH